MVARICVVGSINIDLVARGTRFPTVGETLIGTHFMTAPGGKGANQAVAASRLGAQVSMVGRVGTDHFAAQLIENLQKNQVNTTHIICTPQLNSGVALIMVDQDGQNTIMVVPGANMLLSPDDVHNAGEIITSADILLLQLESPIETVIEAARMAHEHKVKVILNPAPVMPVPASLWPYIDILIPNEHEAQILAGMVNIPQVDPSRVIDRLTKLGPGIIILTLGSKGALMNYAGESETVPAFVVEPIDTTAAGDAFIGGFSVAIAEGLHLKDAVRWANACGALATTKMGAQPSLPNRLEVNQLLNSKFR
jgi:ribokinase